MDDFIEGEMVDKSEKKSIFFIGMMASGKSTVGAELARQLGWSFFDSDEVIVSRKRKSVSEIFREEGEANFRFYETQVIAELTSLSRVVVALGGGAPMFDVNRRLLTRGLVVQLVASVSDVLERTRKDESRPLLMGADPLHKIRSILLERSPVYESISDVSVHVSRRSPEQIVKILLKEPDILDVVAAGNKISEVVND